MGRRPSGSVVLRLCFVIGSFLAERRHIALLPIVAVLLQSAASDAMADQRILAMSGDVQAGSSGALLASLTPPTINDAGQAVFQATLVDGIGGVGSHNDSAIWLVDNASRRLLAWKGSGGLPAGASFASFVAASIANDGDVAFRAATDAGKQGYWRALGNGVLETIAATGVKGVPGPQLQNAEFHSFGFRLIHSSSDRLAFDGRMVNGIGGVASDTSRGLWRNDGSSTTILVRQTLSEAPGLPSAQFGVPTAEGINRHGQVAMLAALVSGFGGVTPNDALGIWRVGGEAGSDVMIARRGSGAAAGTDNAHFLAFSELRINGSGAVSYVGELEQVGAVTSANNRGLWLYDGAENRLGYCPKAVLLGRFFRFVGSRLEHDASDSEVGDSKKAHEGGA
jgi:hypothetical protein